jgi:hypothetical protein
MASERGPFTEQELAAAAAVPMTDDILYHALRIGTQALSEFGYSVMERVFRGQLNLNDRENAISMTSSGFWLLLLGFLMSVGMVLHYVVGAQYSTGHDFMSNITLWFACPWTLSTAVVLGGAFCMVAIGAVHTALARFPGAAEVGPGTSVARWFCAASLVAIFLTGYVGYFVVDAFWPRFYYEPVTQRKNVWLRIHGRDQEGPIRLLPLHRAPRSVWQHVRSRRGADSSVWRALEADPDPDRTRRQARDRASGKPD